MITVIFIPISMEGTNATANSAAYLAVFSSNSIMTRVDRPVLVACFKPVGANATIEFIKMLNNSKWAMASMFISKRGVDHIENVTSFYD